MKPQTGAERIYMIIYIMICIEWYIYNDIFIWYIYMIYIHIYDIYLLRQNWWMFNCTPDFLVEHGGVPFLNMVTTFFKFSGCPLVGHPNLDVSCFETDEGYYPLKLAVFVPECAGAKNFGMFPKIGFFHPKSSILIWFSIINNPLWGTTIFGNPHINSFF